MKAKKEIREKLCRYLQRQLDALVVEAKEEIRKIKQSSTVEEIMYHKQQLLHAYTDFFPIGARYCYFCLQFANVESCETCSYAFKHGACKEEGSDYDELENAVASLRNAIARYYQGEKYRKVKENGD